MSRGKAYELWIYKHHHLKIATEAFSQHWLDKILRIAENIPLCR